MNYSIKIYKNLSNWLNSIDSKPKKKILKTLSNIKEGNIDPSFFTKLSGNDDLWEVRVRFQQQYRIICFFIKDESGSKSLYLSNGFIKKTCKTPSKEIEKSKQIRRLIKK